MLLMLVAPILFDAVSPRCTHSGLETLLAGGTPNRDPGFCWLVPRKLACPVSPGGDGGGGDGGVEEEEGGS